MAERDLHQQRVKQLLAQDPEINDKQMKEFRMQLELALESSEAKAKQTLRRILIALAVYLGGTFGYFFYLANWGDATPNATANLVRQVILIPLVVASLAAVVIGFLLVIQFLFKYWPRLNRARFDLQMSMLQELQQQMKQLQEKIERRDI
jgi:TRAP-type C4-dicarboxylate transport system permease small subunit